MIFPGILAGFVLFAGGVIASFHWMVPTTLKWFHAYNVSHGFHDMWRVNEYFSFVSHLCLASGLMCELPVVMIVLSLLGFLSYGLLKSTRRYAVALILVLVAVLAPTPDPITFLTL